jgi:alkylation response protein AidB-like acyl-CoA dehydrogenase
VSADVVEPLLRSVKDFTRRHVHALDIDGAHRIPPEVLRGLAELGLFGVTLPEEFGGAGLTALDATRLVATLAEADRSVATTVGLHLGLGTRGLVAWGSQAQKERWLPSLSSGEVIAAFATTEPNSGSDLSALECTARGDATGALTLNGNKIYVTNGGFCSLLTVTASTPGLGGAARGTSVFLVDPTLPGVVRQPEERKLGLRGSSTIGFVFDECALPREALLGEPGQGAGYLAHILSWGRLLLSAGCVGTARVALATTLTHVHTRQQFRRTLIKQEVVQQQLARASALAYAMSALVSRAAAAETDYALLSRLTTSSKVFCSEGAGQIADLAVQLHGGSGYIEDTGLALLVRDARVTRIFEGANDVLLTHAGLQELTEPTTLEPLPGLEPLLAAVRARRDALCGDAKAPGIRALNRRVEQHALGRAVMWRDAAYAAAALARTPLEQAAAELVRDEALAVANAPFLAPTPVSTLTTALLEGVLP